MLCVPKKGNKCVNEEHKYPLNGSTSNSCKDKSRLEAALYLFFYPTGATEMIMHHCKSRVVHDYC